VHRLSGQDAYFLYQETPTALMHTLKIVVCKPAPEGASDQDFRALVQRSMGVLPLFQYRIVPVPFGLHHPLVLNDGGFDFDMHVHRIGVPAPGGREQMDQLIGEIAAGALDRSRPLWEIWIIEGLENGRIAYVNKMHHLLADGVASVNYLGQVLYRDAHDADAVALPHFEREQEPTAWRLIAGALRDLARDFAHLPRLLQDSARRRKQIEARNRDASVVPAQPYSAEIPKLRFNRALSNLRNYATAQFELEQLRDIRRHFGGTVNDALLGILAGALRRYLQRRGELPERPLVCAIPVSADQEAAATRTSGNNVAYFHVRLRTDLDEREQRYAATLAEAQAAKEVLELLGKQTAHEWMQYIPPLLFSRRRQQDYRAHAADRADFPLSGNLILSNVPGPRELRYTARGDLCEALYSAGPLTEGTGLNITFWSYAGQMNLGAIACKKSVPNLRRLVDDIHEEFAALLAAAGTTRPATEEAS
jgi:diacylglycerol O-acyltransferase / wax synthase